MKKHNILKVLGLSFLVLVVLTWIIPAGSYASGNYENVGTIPLGLFDLTRVPLVAITNLIQYTLVILVIGGFYGVLNKTGVYTSFTEKIAKKMKGKEKRFLIFSILLFAIISSVSGANFAAFMLVPFFAAVIMLIGYNKVTAMLSTIGAMLVGFTASTTNSDAMTIFMQYFGIKFNSEILAKIVLFVMLVVLFILFVIKISKIETKKVAKKEVKKETKKTSKKETKTDKKKETKTTKTKKATTKAETKDEVITVKEEKNIPLFNGDVKDNKKSFVPLLIVFLIIFVISMIAMFNWSSLLNIKVFDDIYQSMIGIKLGNYTIVKNILGTFSPFGYWTNYEFIMFIMLAIPFIAWLYNVKFDNAVDGFVEGAKQVLKPAVYVLLANILYAAMFNNQSGENIFYTVVNFAVGLSDKFNIFVIALITFIGGFIYSDFASLISTIATPITSIYADATTYSLMTFVIQAVYGLVMFIAPSSLLLILGLSYFDISYKDWFKTIWKYLIKVLLVIIIVIVVITMFV